MSIQKLFGSRRPNVSATTYVGSHGNLFYDEATGLLRISDGVTPGGHVLTINPATTTVVGGIKAGPGANVSVDGTLTIDTTGIPLSVGDLYIAQANISAVNANEDLNLFTNGTGNINLVGNLRVQTTSAGLYSTPVFEVDNRGNLTVNGNLITNGGTYLVGTTTFVGPTVHQGNITATGNLTTIGNLITNGPSYFNGDTNFVGAEVNTGNVTINGNLIVNGPSYFVGNVTEVGNLTITGNSVNNGTSVFNGVTYQNGNVITTGVLTIVGNTNQVGNLTITGTTVNNGISVFNGNLTIAGNAALIGNTTVAGNTTVTGNTLVTGNTFVTGNTTVVGQTFLTGNSYVTGNTFVTGNTTVTGTTYVVGNTYVTGQITTITGNTYLTGNSFISGAAYVTGPTTVTGNVTVTGNMLQSGQSIFNITQQNSVQGAVEITGDANAQWQTPVNTGVMLHVTGQSNNSDRVYFDSLGSYSVLIGRRFEGSMSSPTGVQGNVDLFRVGGGMYTTAGWANIGPARMSFATNEIQTGTNQGGRIEFWTTANSAGPAWSTITRTATIDPALGVTSNIGFVTAGNVTAGNIAVSASGTLSTPRVILNDGGVRQLTGNTTVTLDFSTDSMVSLTNPTGTVTITLANYTAGSIIRFIYSSATARTINLGVAAAVNSTTGGTTLLSTGGGAPVGPNQSVILTYYCVGGTAATTYVSASYV